MSTYIRYETRAKCRDTYRPLGVFGSAYRIVDGCGLPEVSRAMLRESLTWFEDNLMIPREKKFDELALFWFRSRATEMLSRLWGMIVVLNDEGITVRKIVTDWPGRIIYRDEHQVAAIPTQQFNALRV